MKQQNNISLLSSAISALIAAACAAMLAGCSTTKRIPEGEQLYIGVKKIDIKAPEGEKVPEKCPVCDHDRGYFIRFELSPFEGKQ